MPTPLRALQTHGGAAAVLGLAALLGAAALLVVRTDRDAPPAARTPLPTAPAEVPAPAALRAALPSPAPAEHEASAPALPRATAARAWFRAGKEPRTKLLAEDLTGAAGLRDAALRFLTRHARQHPDVRATLTDYLTTDPEPPRCRGEALHAVLRWGSDQELHDVLPALDRERDRGVLLRAVEALRDSDARTARGLRQVLEHRHGLTTPPRGPL